MHGPLQRTFCVSVLSLISSPATLASHLGAFLEFPVFFTAGNPQCSQSRWLHQPGAVARPLLPPGGAAGRERSGPGPGLGLEGGGKWKGGRCPLPLGCSLRQDRAYRPKRDGGCGWGSEASSSAAIRTAATPHSLSSHGVEAAATAKRCLDRQTEEAAKAKGEWLVHICQQRSQKHSWSFLTPSPTLWLRAAVYNHCWPMARRPTQAPLHLHTPCPCEQCAAPESQIQGHWRNTTVYL